MGDLMQTPATMSSLEIAELTGKRHDHVMRDIRNMLSELGGEGLPSFGDTHTNPQNGQGYPIFRLPRRECLILVSGYSVELRARIIDRWEQLERGAAPASLSGALAAALRDPTQALALLTDQVTLNAELRGQIEGMKPEVEAFGRIAKADGSTCVTDAAKVLQVRPKDLFAFLRSNGWLYRRPGSGVDLGYQSKIMAGLLEHKVTVVTRNDGTEKETVQVRVTAKGLTVLAKLIPPAAQAA